MKGTFHEATPYQRICFTIKAFEDERGNAQLIVVNTVTFASANGYTQFEWETKVIRATPIVKESLPEMQQGWSQGLDKLQEYLQKIKT
jgi:uncharacterized protein YndB with AHSA1/START domain